MLKDEIEKKIKLQKGQKKTRINPQLRINNPNIK
jgi:hypothetical protein